MGKEGNNFYVRLIYHSYVGGGKRKEKKERKGKGGEERRKKIGVQKANLFGLSLKRKIKQEMGKIEEKTRQK